MLQEGRWLAEQGVKELFLVSENSTSYGKDLGDLRLLETLLPELAAVDGIERIRVSYLQPAETRPGLIEAIAGTPGVAPYFDLSFQHASATVLRRMRRFGDSESFLDLLDRIRKLAPEAGVRSNVIVGFPGETDDDLATLCDFLVAARLDVTGVFGYSDEDGTEAASYDGKLDADEIADTCRAGDRDGRGAQLPARRGTHRRDCPRAGGVDGRGRDRGARRAPGPRGGRHHHDHRADIDLADVRVGDLVTATVTGTDGVDLDRGRGVMTDAAPKVNNFNVPNVLTTVRIVLVPFFGWALLHDGGDSIGWRCAAFVIFVVAMITDKIDGDYARKYNLVTNFGKIADPIADKAVTGMAFVGLSIVGDIWWWVTIVVLLREWSVTLLRLSVLKHVVIAAAQSGKIKTVFQVVALAGLALPLPHGDEAHDGAFDRFGLLGELVFYASEVMLAAAVAMTLWSGYEFFRSVWRQRKIVTNS